MITSLWINARIGKWAKHQVGKNWSRLLPSQLPDSCQLAVLKTQWWCYCTGLDFAVIFTFNGSGSLPCAVWLTTHATEWQWSFSKFVFSIKSRWLLIETRQGSSMVSELLSLLPKKTPTKKTPPSKNHFKIHHLGHLSVCNQKLNKTFCNKNALGNPNTKNTISFLLSIGSGKLKCPIWWDAFP